MTASGSLGAFPLHGVVQAVVKLCGRCGFAAFLPALLHQVGGAMVSYPGAADIGIVAEQSLDASLGVILIACRGHLLNTLTIPRFGVIVLWMIAILSIDELAAILISMRDLFEQDRLWLNCSTE